MAARPASGDGVLFLGVGRMGAPMAMRLADAGVPLAVADSAPAALQPFAARGIATADRGRDLPGDVVMTMLPTGAHVREALLGEGGACTGRPRALVVEMSTASPDDTVALAAELAARGVALVDAPVSGGMAGARDGSLIAMAGGSAADFARAGALLSHLCASATLVGPTGSGHIVKALNNVLSAVTLWATSEAMVIGERLGLDARAMLEVWTEGSGRSHASEVKLPRHVLTGAYDFGQTLELFCKDIGIAEGLAERADLPAPAIAAAAANWRALRDSLGGAEDITAVARYLAQTTR